MSTDRNTVAAALAGALIRNNRTTDAVSAVKTYLEVLLAIRHLEERIREASVAPEKTSDPT